MRVFLLLTVLCLLVSSPARAEIEAYAVDLPHTQVLFSVGHLGFSHSHGRFRDIKGGFEFNRSEPEKSKINVTIQTASVDMADKSWNDAVMGEDYFDVNKYPAMTFVSRNITLTGEKTAQITGDLTLLGATKPVILDVTFNKADKHPFSGKYVAGFSAHASINRSDFGMTSGVPWVSDRVDIIVEVEGIRKGKGTENE
ncbi:MAG TPA: YceI family protein [Micavibrio sp.]|nr:YceI family protein [Micavibrio sp.]